MSARFGAAVVIGGVLIACLAACSTAQPEPTTTAPPGSTEAPSETPAPTATTTPSEPATALDIPACEEIFPLADVRAQFDDRIEFFPDLDDVPSGLLPEPAVQEAVTTAAATVTCTWGYPASDGLFHITVADIAPATGDELIALFRADGGYTESAHDGAPVFTRVVEDAMQYTLSHALSGQVWVIVDGTIIDEESAARLAGAGLTTVLDAGS